MSAALAPHCWNATSFAVPEYVMDLGSPNAFWAFAITAFASCAAAFPFRYARQIANRASLFTTAIPPLPPETSDSCPGIVTGTFVPARFLTNLGLEHEPAPAI